MKVVVCQGETFAGPTRDELVAAWKKEMNKIVKVDELVFKDRFNYENIDETIEDADAVIGVWIKDGFYTDEFFKKHPKLKYIATTAHGFGNIDNKSAANNEVTFTNTVYGDTTIAEYAFALLMDIAHGVSIQNKIFRDALNEGRSVHMGRNYPFKVKQIELYQKTIGIIGLGAIGLHMARIANGLGMHVISYNRHIKKGSHYDFIEQVSLEEVYRRSDVISIHCPLTDETKNMIDKNAFAKMKDGVIIINTARGDIIVEDDLVEALKSGKVYAAGLDVVCNEMGLNAPIPLMDCQNVVITPHVAWLTEESRYRTIRIATENLKNWIDGHPTSVINGKD